MILHAGVRINDAMGRFHPSLPIRRGIEGKGWDTKSAKPMQKGRGAYRLMAQVA